MAGGRKAVVTSRRTVPSPKLQFETGQNIPAGVDEVMSEAVSELSEMAEELAFVAEELAEATERPATDETAEETRSGRPRRRRRRRGGRDRGGNRPGLREGETEARPMEQMESRRLGPVGAA